MREEDHENIDICIMYIYCQLFIIIHYIIYCNSLLFFNISPLLFNI